MTIAERARAYISKMPAAIAGKGGHDTTFKVAVALVHGFGLTEEQAWPIFCEYNQGCEPPWNETELRHKLENASNLTRHSMPRGYLAGVSHRNAVGISVATIYTVKPGRLYPLTPRAADEGKSQQKTAPSPKRRQDAKEFLAEGFEPGDLL